MKMAVVTLAIFMAVALARNTQATIFSFDDTLSSSQVSPPNPSPGTGEITGTYDDVTNSFSFSLSFSGLTTPTTAAHLHAPAPAGTNAPVEITFAGFPFGVTSGSFNNTYIFSSSQETSFLADLMYVDIHTAGFPGGEIRAQLLPTVPDQGGTFGLMGLALVGLVAFARWSRRLIVEVS